MSNVQCNHTSVVCNKIERLLPYRSTYHSLKLAGSGSDIKVEQGKVLQTGIVLHYTCTEKLINKSGLMCGVTTFRKMTFSIKAHNTIDLMVTLSMRDSQHHEAQHKH